MNPIWIDFCSSRGICSVGHDHNTEESDICFAIPDPTVEDTGQHSKSMTCSFSRLGLVIERIILNNFFIVPFEGLPAIHVQSDLVKLVLLCCAQFTIVDTSCSMWFALEKSTVWQRPCNRNQLSTERRTLNFHQHSACLVWLLSSSCLSLYQPQLLWKMSVNQWQSCRFSYTKLESFAC